MSYCKIISASLASFFMVLAMPISAADFQKTNGPAVKTVNDSKLGEILTDSKGMTLYIFTTDTKNVSNCYDECAKAWPPFLVQGQPQNLNGKFGVITRRDNTRQLTYDGKALYYYVKDKKPGDTYGQNVENKWFVVNPNKENTNYNNGSKY